MAPSPKELQVIVTTAVGGAYLLCQFITVLLFRICLRDRKAKGRWSYHDLGSILAAELICLFFLVAFVGMYMAYFHPS